MAARPQLVLIHGGAESSRRRPAVRQRSHAPATELARRAEQCLRSASIAAGMIADGAPHSVLALISDCLQEVTAGVEHLTAIERMESGGES